MCKYFQQTQKYKLFQGETQFQPTQKAKHADYKQITATRPKSTNFVTIDYQPLTF